MMIKGILAIGLFGLACSDALRLGKYDFKAWRSKYDVEASKAPHDKNAVAHLQAAPTPTPTSGATTTTTSATTSTVVLVPNAEWTYFRFGTGGTFVPDVFAVATTTQLILQVTDLMCSGDRFAVYDNGVLLGNSSVPTFDECRSNTESPNTAYGNSTWSSFHATLGPGVHAITIKVLISVYGSGSGAIRVKSPLAICDHSASGLTVIQSPSPFIGAADMCQSIGKELANITVYNFNAATQLVFDCVGPSRHAFIRSYWGNTYQNSCLALYSGSAAPGGAVSVPADCFEASPAICQNLVA